MTPDPSARLSITPLTKERLEVVCYKCNGINEDSHSCDAGADPSILFTETGKLK